jgi:non-specific protein-tyrosine kinase
MAYKPKGLDGIEPLNIDADRVKVTRSKWVSLQQRNTPSVKQNPKVVQNAMRSIKSMPTNPGDVGQEQSGFKNVQVSSSGWISPQYREPRRVELEYNQLEKNRLVGLMPEYNESSHFKVLRAQIQQRMQENGWKTLMVTSVHPGEGKSMIAINLAAMFAKEFHQTVLLVDADLKSQSIHRYLGYESDKGLVDYLLGDAEMRDILVWPGVEKLTVISGGRICEQGTEVLNSPRMCSLVGEMKNRYQDRYVFFDLPPVLGRADAMAFSKLVDAIVVVVQNGRTPLPDIQKALSYLPKEKFLGFILNQH